MARHTAITIGAVCVVWVAENMKESLLVHC